jgi:hypothetical protein
MAVPSIIDVCSQIHVNISFTWLSESPLYLPSSVREYQYLHLCCEVTEHHLLLMQIHQTLIYVFILCTGFSFE